MERKETTVDKDLRIIVQFDEPIEGFRTGVPYTVTAMDGRYFLLVDEEGRFRWIASEQCRPHLIEKPDETIFERSWHEVRKRNEALLGKRVVIRSLEEMGVPGEQRDKDGFFSFCGKLEGFERDLMTVVGEGDSPVVAKITHQQVYSIEEA